MMVCTYLMPTTKYLCYVYYLSIFKYCLQHSGSFINTQKSFKKWKKKVMKVKVANEKHTQYNVPMFFFFSCLFICFFVYLWRKYQGNRNFLCWMRWWGKWKYTLCWLAISVVSYEVKPFLALQALRKALGTLTHLAALQWGFGEDL